MSLLPQPIEWRMDCHALGVILGGLGGVGTWGILSDAFEEGGFKHSGIGRSRGLRAMEEFQ
jgi:hypothetical protein